MMDFKGSQFEREIILSRQLANTFQSDSPPNYHTVSDYLLTPSGQRGERAERALTQQLPRRTGVVSSTYATAASRVSL